MKFSFKLVFFFVILLFFFSCYKRAQEEQSARFLDVDFIECNNSSNKVVVKNISSDALMLLRIEDPHVTRIQKEVIFGFLFTDEDMPFDDNIIHEKRIYRSKLLMPNDAFELSLPGIYLSDKELNVKVKIGLKVLTGGEVVYSYSEPSRDIIDSQKIVTQQVQCY